MYYCWSSQPIDHDQLEKPPGAINAENQISSRIFGNLIHYQRVMQDVSDILWFNVVPMLRTQTLHNCVL